MKVLPESVSEIDKRLHEMNVSRRSRELSWFYNHLNYMGFQWNQVDSSTGSIQDVPSRVRFRANKIQPAISHSVAKLTRNPPDWDVDSDIHEQGIQSARNVAERYLEYVWDKEGMPVKSKELMTSVRIYGTSFLHVSWDPDAGDELNPRDFFAEERDLPQLLETFAGDEKKALAFLSGKYKVRTGDILIEHLSPFYVYLDETATSIKGARWAIICKRRSLDEVRQKWGKAAKDVVEEKSDILGQSYLHYLRQIVSPNVSTGAPFIPGIVEGGVTVKELWERPSVEHPKGRLVIVAGNTTLHEGDNPFVGSSAEIPLVRFRDQLVVDSIWGQASLDHAIPIQRDYNKARSDGIEHRHSHAAGKWLVPRGAGVVQGALDNRADEVIEFNPIALGTGSPVTPQRVQPGSTSPLLTEALGICDSELSEVFGLHDVSKGTVPSGISSGVAIELLQEADDTRLGSVLEEAHAGYADLGRMVLDLCQKFVTETREFQAIMGEDAEGEILEFTGRDLSYRNVKVRMGSILFRKRAARQQKVMELLQYGGLELFNTPELRKLLMNAVGLAVDFYDPMAQHEKRALYENQQIKRGEFPLVLDWQDDDTHIRIHEAEMNSLAFDRMPPQVQQMFMMHRQQHKDAKTRKMAEMAMQGMALQPQVPGSVPGTAPQIPGAGPVPASAESDTLGADLNMGEDGTP